MRVVFLLLLAAAAPAEEGFVMVPGGPVWYRVTGTGRGVPVIAVHGGPGGTSCGFERLAPLGADRRVVVYDQLGTGRSGRPIDRTRWTVEHFVEELHAVRRRLGLKRVHLLGHSWGGSVVAAYALSKGTRGVESLILASPLLSTADWIRDADVLRRQLPAEVQATLRKHEAAGTTDSKEYAAAEAEFNRRFLHRKEGTRPEACADAPGNGAMYQAMWGPSEFHATGSLKTFDVTGRLGELRVPVLLVVGEFDEARPETAARYRKMIPGSRLEVIKGAAHALWSDQPESSVGVVREWLTGVESK